MRAPSRRLLIWLGAATVASVGLFVFPGAWPLLLVADTLLVLAALVDWIGAPGPASLTAERIAPLRLGALEPYTIRVRIASRSRIPLRIRLRDTPPPELAAATEELSGVVSANGERIWEYAVRPTSRGCFAWGPINLRYRSLLGLWDFGLTVPAPGEVRVYPSLADLKRYHLLAAANRLESIGMRKVRPRGSALEFESLREYTFGDDLRLLDWKATARRGRLIVRQQQAERNQTVILLLDCGRLMNAREGAVTKLDHAVNAALLLAHVALARNDRVGLAVFSHKVHAWLAPRGHTSQNRLIAEALYDLRGDYTESDHGRCLEVVAAQHPKRSLLVVLTDFVDATTAADMVAQLQHAGRRHLILFAALKDAFLERLAAVSPENAGEGFRMAAAVDLLRERQAVLEKVRRFGAFVIDAEPGAIAPPLVNQFVEIVSRGLI